MKVLLNSFHSNGHTPGFHPPAYVKVRNTIIDLMLASGSERVKVFILAENFASGFSYIF